MSRLTWGETSQRRYEAGVDRGVLYPANGSGVPWNGLVSVEESTLGGEVTSFHYDGVKYLDFVGPKTYQATLTAFSAPEQFSPHIGHKSVVPGFVLTRQARDRFGLSYRTGMGDRGYKLHIVYNALASPQGRGHSTLNATPSAGQVSWKVDATPIRQGLHRPSAHFIFDSTKMDPAALAVIESILYGSDTTEPRLPSMEEVLGLTEWSPLIIIPQSVSGLSQLVPGSGDLYRTSMDGVLRAPPGTRLYMSPINGLYRME